MVCLWMGEKEISSETTQNQSLLDILLAKIGMGGLDSRE
jgi:hypothetical protein